MIHISWYIVGAGDVLYTGAAMPSTRIAKTFERLRAGELPAPTTKMKFLAGGLGFANSCSGCGELVGRFERCYYIRVGDHVGDGALLRFHVVCHETWVRFKRAT